MQDSNNSIKNRFAQNKLRKRALDKKTMRGKAGNPQDHTRTSFVKAKEAHADQGGGNEL